MESSFFGGGRAIREDRDDLTGDRSCWYYQSGCYKSMGLNSRD